MTLLGLSLRRVLDRQQRSHPTGVGVDRDSEELPAPFDERDPAVIQMIQDVIARVHEAGRPIGIRGQAPSDHADFARTLVEAGIDSISLNPDMDVIEKVAEYDTEYGG